MQMPISFLKECFDFDVAQGTLTWKARPLEHFSNLRAWKIWNTRFSFKPSGSFTINGYLTTMIRRENVSKRFLVHRIGWAIYFGEWPASALDHIDGDVTNNRICNLRLATACENAQNISKPNANSTTGLLGVYAKKGNKNWRSQIKVNGKQIHLGTFKTQEEASIAYLSAKRDLHPFSMM